MPRAENTQPGRASGQTVSIGCRSHLFQAGSTAVTEPGYIDTTGCGRNKLFFAMAGNESKSNIKPNVASHLTTARW